MRTLIFILFLLGFLLPFVFLGYTASYLYLDYFSAALFIIFSFYLVNKDKNFFSLMFYLFFGFITTILISLIVEHGVYLIEINEISYATGITFKGALTAFLFISATYIGYLILGKTNVSVRNLDHTSENLVYSVIRIITLAICLILLITLTRYGYPLFMGIHRADYWASYAPSWGGTLAFWLVQLAFPLGYMYAKKKLKKDFFIFLFLLGITILAGARFTGILQSLVYFFIPIIILSQTFKFTKIKFIIPFACLFVILFSIVLNSFETNSKNAQKENLFLRLVLQSQMWWALDNISTTSPRDSDEIIKSYLGFTDNSKEKSVNYLMFLVAPTTSVLTKTDTDSTYTMSGFFNSYYFFGYFLGGGLNVIYGLMLGFLVYILMLSIYSNNLILSFIAFKLFVKIQNIFLNGNADNLLDLSTFIFIIMIILFLTLSNKKSISYAK